MVDLAWLDRCRSLKAKGTGSNASRLGYASLQAFRCDHTVLAGPINGLMRRRGARLEGNRLLVATGPRSTSIRVHCADDCGRSDTHCGADTTRRSQFPLISFEVNYNINESIN